MLFSTQTEVLFPALGEEAALDLFREAGYSALDFTMYSSEKIKEENWREYAKSIREMAKDRGIIFNQMHAPFGGGATFYMSDTRPLLPSCIEFASIIGARNIVIHPIQIPRYYGHEEEHFTMNMEFYRSLAPYAKEYGVKIAIENMWQTHPVTHRIVDDVCADPYEHIRYFDTLDDSDAFTLCLDLGHVALCEREPENSIRLLGRDRLGCIHAHDVDYVRDLHTIPGLSRLNWDEICRALGEIDYRGDFTLEADDVYKNMPKEVYPEVCRLSGAVAKQMARKIDEYRDASNRDA